MYSLLWGMAVLVIGAAITAVPARREVVGWLSVIFVAAAAVLLLSGATGPALSGTPAETVELLAIPGLGASLAFGLDGLSALFLILVVVVSLMAALYSVKYLGAYTEEAVRRYYPFFLLSVASMVGVVMIRDWLFFIVLWELMGLTTYMLVVYARGKQENVRAGLKYLIMTHAGALGIIAAVVVVWSVTQPQTFAFGKAFVAMRDLWANQPWLFHVLLLLWFVGFATKAGVFPMGDWVPDAYPAAPASASALLSGVVSKIGIYGILRVFLGVVGAGVASRGLYEWGVIIALLGTVSAVLGSLTAVRQGRAKRLLAFSSMAQVGFILLALGVGMALLGLGLPLAMVAMAAAVFHMVNDALFKPLLFFGAGALHYRTGTDDLDKVGGLLRFLPVTALATVVGVLALAGVPPLNGFASKWLIYETVLLGAPLQVPAAHMLFAVLAVGALFVSLVSLAYGLEFAGTAFLGKPLLPPGEEAPREVPFSMLAPQIFLAAACVFVGLFPGPIVRVVWNALSDVGGTGGWGFQYETFWGGLRLAGRTGWAGAWLPVPFVATGVLVLVIVWAIKALSPAKVRQVPAWYGGEQVPDEQIRFHAHGFYRPFADAVRNVYPAIGLPRAARPKSLEAALDTDIWLFRPLVEIGRRLVDAIRRTHVGLPQMYLIWQVLGAVFVLAALVLLLGQG